jgi:hypothetical protein
MSDDQTSRGQKGTSPQKKKDRVIRLNPFVESSSDDESEGKKSEDDDAPSPPVDKGKGKQSVLKTMRDRLNNQMDDIITATPREPQTQVETQQTTVIENTIITQPGGQVQHTIHTAQITHVQQQPQI